MSVVDWTMSSQEQSSYASDEETEEEEEQSPVKKMRHVSNEGTGWARELFNRQFTGGPGPLRLNLTKSPSLLELMQKELDQATKVKRKQDTESSEMQGTKRSEKLTASHFQASLLRIGDWERKSRYEGDLVAKFYFNKSKIVWEIMHEGLKSKMEIKFSDICVLKVTYPKGLRGTLDITVSREPYFFRETNPQPRRNTRWLSTRDFTGGQAGTFRHVLHCDPGIIDKHIENLFCKDNRLLLLSQENTINPESPYLEPWCPVPNTPKSWSHQNPYHTDDGNQFETEQIAQPLPLNPTPTETTTGGLNHHGASSLDALLQSSVGHTSVVADEPSGVSDQWKCDMFSWDKYFQKTRATTQTFMSNAGKINISDKVNHMNNQMNSGNSYGRFDVSSSRMTPPEVIRRYPDDSTANQQVEPVNRPSNAHHGVLFPSSSVPASTPTVTTEEASGRRPQAQLKKDMFNWKSFLQTPREMHHQHSASNSNAGIMNTTATVNRISKQINPWSFHSSSVDHSSSRTNHQLQVNPWSRPSYSNGFNGDSSQTFLQIETAGNPPPPSNGGMISPETAALEQICRELLGNDEVADPAPAEEEWLASTVNSLSCLIGQAAAAPSAPSSQSSSSLQANNAQAAPPTQVTNEARSGSGDSDGDGGGRFPPSMMHWPGLP